VTSRTTLFISSVALAAFSLISTSSTATGVPTSSTRQEERAYMAARPNVGSRQLTSPCRMTSIKVWLRKSGNFKTVGAKPKTVCSMTVLSIHQVTQLEHRFLGLWLPAGAAFAADRGPARRLEQKNVEVQRRRRHSLACHHNWNSPRAWQGVQGKGDHR
jgi:hypothetical protein